MIITRFSRLMFLYFFTLFLVISFSVSVHSQEVEVEVGPEFDPSDPSTLNSCFSSAFSNKFPWDFVAPPIADSGGVSPTFPSITLFGYTNEFPWIIDVFTLIEPAFIATLFYQAIINL